MSTGIAKSAEQTKPTPAPVITNSTQLNTTTYDNIPVDVYRFFGENIGSLEGREKDKLTAISEWAFRDSETVGDGLIKLRNLEMKLGSPSIGEKRYDRLFNWVKMQKQIEDMQKRQEALRRL